MVARTEIRPAAAARIFLTPPVPGLYKDEAHCPAPCIVKDLDTDNFNETVLVDTPKNNRIWVVEFYSDRCPICKGLAPEIRRAAIEIEKLYPGQVTLAGVNSRVYHELAEAHGILSYPWVAAFYKGKKIDDMAGLSGWESVALWGKAKMESDWKPQDDQKLACKAIKDAGSLNLYPKFQYGTAVVDGDKTQAVAEGAIVQVTSDEAALSACVAEKGKAWEGKMQAKRAKFLGKAGVVKALDTERDAVQVVFDEDMGGAEMWWGVVYLKLVTPAPGAASDAKEL